MKHEASGSGFLGRPQIAARYREQGGAATPPAPGLVKRALRWVAARVLGALDVGSRQRVLEGLAGGTLLGNYGAGDEDLSGYRPLATRIDSITRDLDATTYDQQIRQALWLYGSNPLAKWLVNKLVDLTIGDAVTFSVELDRDAVNLGDERAKAIEREIRDHLNLFWRHRAHSLADRAPEYIRTQLITGALVLPVTINQADGVPSLDLIDAQQIAKVESADRSAIVAGRVWYRGQASPSGDARPLEVIREDENGEMVGEAFYFPLRSLLNSLMGTSYLLPATDWLDRHDQFLFASLDRARGANTFVWSVLMEGASPQECQALAADYRAKGSFTSPGGVVVTNEKGGLQAVSPDLRSGDVDVMARTFRLHILGSYDFPESWFAAGGETNRATASDQTSVALKTLEAWQGRFRRTFETMLAFAYDSGRRAQANGVRRAWPRRADVRIKVDLPEMKESDFAQIAQVLNGMEASLEAAIEARLISRETAREKFWSALGKVGADVSRDDEKARIEAEAEEDEKSGADAANRSLADRLAKLGADDGEDEFADEGAGPGQAPAA